MERPTVRQRLEAALAKPLVDSPDDIQSAETFDPWHDVIQGIYGSYNSRSDDLMIAALKAVRDGTTFEFIKAEGFIAEFMLYILAGHGLTEYGTSPRGAWVEHAIEDLWQPLIDKWEAYSAEVWKP
jgi:hypothetical protein